MNLTNKRRIAASLLKVGKTRVWFDPTRLDEIKEAITKADFNKLIKDWAIQARPMEGNSRFRIRKNILQKRKGRKAGKGSRKGPKTSRLSRKETWMQKVRAQRGFVKFLKENNKISVPTYRNVYSKIKGGYFRSRRHIKLYLTEQGLFLKAAKK